MICVFNSTCYPSREKAVAELNLQEVPDSPASESCSCSLSGSGVSSDADGPCRSQGADPIEALLAAEKEPEKEELSVRSCRRAARGATDQDSNAPDPEEAWKRRDQGDLLVRLAGWTARTLADCETQFVSPRGVVFLNREDALRHARATCGGPAAGIAGEEFGALFDDVLETRGEVRLVREGDRETGPTEAGAVRVRVCRREPNVLDLHFPRPAKKAKERRRRALAAAFAKTTEVSLLAARAKEEDEESDRLTLELNELLRNIRRTLEDEAEEDDFVHSPLSRLLPEPSPFRGSAACAIPPPATESYRRPCPASRRRRGPSARASSDRSKAPPLVHKRPRPDALDFKESLSKRKALACSWATPTGGTDEDAGPDAVESPQEPIRSGALSPSDDLLPVPSAPDSTQSARAAPACSRNVRICLLDVFFGGPLHLFNCCGCSKVYNGRDFITFNAVTKTMNRTCAKCSWVTKRTFETSNQKY